MKPHFHPGDQVITKDGHVGVISRRYQGNVTRNWYYIVGEWGDVFTERDLWHVNDTIAQERAYARKGIVVPSDHGEDDPHPHQERGL